MSEVAAGQPSYAAVHTEVEQQAHRSWFSRNRPKLVAAMLWIMLIAACQWYVHANQLGQLDALRRFVDVMQTSLYGPLIFIGIYTLRPLIFFSAIVLTVLGGFLLGPFWGIVYTVIGANASATLAYFIGRYFGVGALESDGSSGLVVPWTTYTDPEVAHVGIYLQDAGELGLEIDTFQQSIGEVDRGRADGEKEGFVKIHVKRGTDEIVGATIVARHAGEMINELTLAMSVGLGLKTLSTVIHPYPTQAEAIKKVADAYNRQRLTPRVHSLFSKWLAWTRR